MASIQELTESRKARAERLVDLINEASAEFKDLHACTGALGELLYRQKIDKGLRLNGRSPNMTGEVIPGMSSLPQRVQSMIDYAIFGNGRNIVDLLQSVIDENNAALREAQNG